MKILAPKNQGFPVEVPALQDHICYSPLSIEPDSLLKVVLVAKIENPLNDKLLILSIIDFGNVPEKRFVE